MTLSGYGVPNTGLYQRQQDDLTYKYSTDQATNAYARFLSQQRGERNLGDMQQSFERALPGQYAQFNRRGLSAPGIYSGTQQQSMQNYLGDYTQSYGRTQQDNAQALQQYDLTGMQNTANYQSQLDALEAQKQQEIANAALGIEALRPFLGGT